MSQANRPSLIFWAVKQGASRCRVRGDTEEIALNRAKRFGFIKPDSITQETDANGAPYLGEVEASSIPVVLEQPKSFAEAVEQFRKSGITRRYIETKGNP